MIDAAIGSRYVPDCCPDCAADMWKPYDWFEAAGSVRAEYRCDECGRRWFTSYDRRSWLNGVPCRMHVR